jgi:hypothetical protein
MPELMSMPEHHLRAMSDAVSATGRLAQPCLIPVLNSPKVHETEAIGTALYIEYEDRKYVFSAAHVFDMEHQEHFYAPGAHGFTPLYGPTKRMNSVSLPGDRHDIFALQVQDALAEELSQFRPLRIRRVDAVRVCPPHARVLFLGYPTSKNRKFGTRTPKFRLRGLSNPTAAAEVYTARKVDPALNVLVDFDPKWCYTVDGQQVEFADPHGMSGGGIWHLFTLTPVGSLPEPYLVGIVLEKFRDTDKYILGVKTEMIVQVLDAFRT